MTTVRPGIAHEWALAHATGRSVFLDDLAPLAGELVVALVGSPVPKGTLRAIEMTGESRRAGAPGIFTFTAADIPGQVHFGAIQSDEAFLALDRVSYVGQPVAVIAAETTEALASSDSLARIIHEGPESPPRTV